MLLKFFINLVKFNKVCKRREYLVNCCIYIHVVSINLYCCGLVQQLTVVTVGGYMKQVMG